MADVSDAWRRLQGDQRKAAMAPRMITTNLRDISVFPPVLQSAAGRSVRNNLVARDGAEIKFFHARAAAVTDLLIKIVGQRYRAGRDPVDPVDLRGVSGRLVIAAERLYQRTILYLCDSYDDWRNPTTRNIPVAEVRRAGLCYGPVEAYAVGGSGRDRVLVLCRHRTEAPSQVLKSFKIQRMGDAYVEELGTYQEMVSFLEDVQEKLVSRNRRRPLWKRRLDAQRKLANLFIEFAHYHNISATPQLSDEDRRYLLKICFLILVKEQAEWQSAHFFNGRSRLGMAVSFARLIILFREGAINLQEMFMKYRVYAMPSMLYRHWQIMRNCQRIDTLYKEEMQLEDDELTEDLAFEDLLEVYGPM